MLMTIGILAGLWAALFQSLSYLASRHFLQVRSGGTRMLLVISHIWMGAASLAILSFVLPSGGIPWRQIGWPVFGTAFFYVLGQIGLMIALRRAQPSQVAPMLVFKIFLLAVMSVIVKGTTIHPIQWLSIALCIAGTFVLNFSTHDRAPLSAMMALMLTCVFYAISDFSIGYLTPAFGDVPRWKAILCGSLVCYGICGLAAVPLLFAFGSRAWSDWREAFPYSAAWFLGMLGLFASFALIGVIYGGILQSTRSIMGVFFAALITRMGHTHIEHMKTGSMFARRLIAAALMTLAVILWAIPGQ